MYRDACSIAFKRCLPLDRLSCGDGQRQGRRRAGQFAGNDDVTPGLAKLGFDCTQFGLTRMVKGHTEIRTVTSYFSI